jgi:hypothetical protein
MIIALDPRGRRLAPPRGLSTAERAAFAGTVRSVKPGHFALEDVPLLVAYASATVQERAISRELETIETETGKDKLRLAHRRVAGKAGDGAPSRSNGAEPEPQPSRFQHGRGGGRAAMGI